MEDNVYKIQENEKKYKGILFTLDVSKTVSKNARKLGIEYIEIPN